MGMLRRGRFTARSADCAADIAAAQRLRYRCFFADHKAGSDPMPRDSDRFDQVCEHVLIEETASKRLVCCFRLLILPSGSDIGASYSAQYYDVSGLASFAAPMIEMGRFCIDPAYTRDPDVLRVAWGALTRRVDQAGAALLFGCSSFHGTEAAAYLDAFAILKERHLAPSRWLPKAKAPKIFRFAARRRRPEERVAMRTMPPLLRTYLMMGGWVSDHAVIDHELNTLHVFTGLEVAAVPKKRARSLRAVAG
ncbi:MAG: GNAT family N-acyltransferase [Pseudomonadota bacterium]